MNVNSNNHPFADWLRHLPTGWATSRLGNVAEIIFSNVDKHTVEGEVPVRLCNYVDVYKNERITSEIPFMEASADAREIMRFQIRRGDVLATKDSETPNDIAISALVAEDLPGVLCGYHLALIRPCRHRLLGPYAAWLHACKTFRAQYEAQAVGVTRFGLSQAAFKEARVPLPLLPEQERIASYLDASCATTDAAVAAKRRQLETLDEIHTATIQRAVTRGLTEKPRLKATDSVWMKEIPEGWQLLALKRISEIQTGLTLGKTYDGPLIERPYLRVANVQDGHLDLNDITTIEVPLDVAKRVELRPGDVLMTEGGDLDKLGRGYIWDGQIADCLHQNHIFAVRCFPHKLLQKFLAYLTASQYGRDYFEATGKRTTNLASTNSTKVGAFPILLPPLDEQARIVEFLDDRTRQHRDIQANIDAQIATLTAYRKSLIHECVTGQYRVTEADVRRVEAQKAAATSWTPRHEETSANEASQ
ncbi:MAG TPA: restriction endonuclease subunit S [Candidatus Binatia bacterium]|nr:restriction endonuclease subunit S [Candidatus Binatia bacterium]